MSEVLTIEQALLKSNEETSFDKIKKHLMNIRHYENLTPALEEVKNRYIFIYTQMEMGTKDADIRKLLQSTYQISYVQCYNDIRATREIFGDVITTDKKVKRVFAEQKALDGYNKCIAKGDFKTAERFLKLYAELAGVLGPDIDTEFLKKIQPNQIVINVSEETIKMIKRINKGGSVDFSKMIPQQEIDNIEYEILSNGEEGNQV